LERVHSCIEKDVRVKGFAMIGILVTTAGILLLTLGLVGASIEVYGRLLSTRLEQQVSSALQQLPSIIQQGGELPTGGGTVSNLGPVNILARLVESLVSTPLWLALTVGGIVLIYLGLYLSQRRGLRRQS